MSLPVVDTHALHQELRTRWDSLWDRLHLIPRTGLFETLMARWGESHRYYHTPQHLAECLRALEEVKSYTDDVRPVEFALWYHDVFHNVEMQSNEEKSAELALSSFVKSGGEAVVGLRIKELVMSTTHRRPVKTYEAAMMVDADLWILGAPPERFDEYEVQVRAEYPRVSDEFFAVARSRLLAKFLTRNAIYRTPILRAKQEVQARMNIERSLKSLSKFK